MSDAFQSFITVERARSAAMAETRRLLAEHTCAREAARLASNPDLDGAVEVVPALTPDDQRRMEEISELMAGPHGSAVLAVLREEWPNLFGGEPTQN